jgi:hypothetical protein
MTNELPTAINYPIFLTTFFNNSMKSLLPFLGLLATGLTASAQSAITLNQSNFPVLPTTVDVYNQVNNVGGVALPVTGANQAWDYRTLVSTSQSSGSYSAPTATPPFAGTTRTYTYSLPLGPLSIRGLSAQGLSATGLRYLGYQIPLQRFGLAPVTGSTTDSLVVTAQTVPVNASIFTFPTTTGTVNRQSYRTGTTGLLTVGAVGLNRVPLRLVQRIVATDSVAGWGTLRVPTTTGGSAATPVLLLRRRMVEVDSFYLAGQPAPALLLTALGLQQGAAIRNYSDAFYRANSSQAMAQFYYTAANYQTLQSVSYSREASLLATKPSLAAAVGGLSAFPNPLAGSPLTIAAGNGSRQAVSLTVRDVLGRRQAVAAARTGESTTVLDGLPAGIYLLEVASLDGARSTLRIVRE